MPTMITTMLLNAMEMVMPRQSEPPAPGCPRPTAVDHLLWRVARGDRDALASVYQQTAAVAFGLALRITGDRTAAEEVTTSVYREAWDSALVLAGNTCFLNWLTESTRRLALERRGPPVAERHTTRPLATAAKVTVNANEEEPVPLPQEWESGRRRARAALAALAPEERAAVELAYFTGLKVGEIADQLHLPEGRVRSLLRSGMMTFRCGLKQDSSARKQ